MPPQQVCYGLIREPRAAIASWDHQNMEVNILSPLTTFHLDFRKEFVYRKSRKSIMFIHWFPVCIWERIIAPFSFEITRCWAPKAHGESDARRRFGDSATLMETGQPHNWSIFEVLEFFRQLHIFRYFLSFWGLDLHGFTLRWWFKYFLFSPLFGEDSQFD